jgi:hypothetical protein
MTLPRKAKGRRPTYADDPTVDKLLAIVMALAGEVSTLRERLDTVERLAASKNLFSSADVEAFQLDEPAMADRESFRVAYLNRLLRIVNEEVEAEARGESAKESERIILEIARGR